MLKIALLRQGNELVPVTYTARSDYYTFTHAGREHRVDADNRIPPLILSDVAGLVDEASLGPVTRAAWRRMRAKGRGHGIELRFFDSVLNATIELPFAAAVYRYGEFLARSTREAVKVDPDTGHVTGLREDSAVKDLIDQLKAIGIRDESAKAFVARLATMQAAGDAASYVRDHVLDRLLPRGIGLAILAAAASIGFLMGVDVASNTALGDWWAGEGNRQYMLLIALPLVGFIAWRSGVR